MVLRPAGGERAYDIYSLLLKEPSSSRHAINDQVANLIVASCSPRPRGPGPHDPVYINCPGGVIYAGLAIYDTIPQIRPPVMTVAVGLTASFGTVLLDRRDEGPPLRAAQRYVHMHQPWFQAAAGRQRHRDPGARDPAPARYAQQDSVGAHRAAPVAHREDTDRDFYMTAQQALDYGLIDGILEPPAKTEKEDKSEDSKSK